MNKKEIRKSISAQRAELSKEFIREYSDIVAGRIIALDEFRNASAVYAFMSYKNEISCEKIIDEALRQGKKVAIPKVLSDESMEFYYIHKDSIQEEGYCGIMEPEGNTEPAKDKNVLLIMPGLAFGKDHSRIGFGGGFYDRYIEKAEKKGRKIFKLAPAYPFQIFDTLPTEEHDIKTDILISAKEIYR